MIRRSQTRILINFLTIKLINRIQTAIIFLTKHLEEGQTQSTIMNKTKIQTQILITALNWLTILKTPASKKTIKIKLIHKKKKKKSNPQMFGCLIMKKKKKRSPLIFGRLIMINKNRMNLSQTIMDLTLWTWEEIMMIKRKRTFLNFSGDEVSQIITHFR